MQSYQSALDYLYTFITPERTPPSAGHDPSRNLRATRLLLSWLGDPHLAFTCVVVAGTKGKGSTSAIIEAMLRAAGYRTGLWTSPHLSSYRERIQINRQPISRDELVSAVAHLRTLMEAHDMGADGPPTTFALGFALALRHFADNEVDMAVLEVGLGGRFDSAAVVPSLAAVITSISYDHTSLLGSTLREIAWNKAGIMHPATPAITVPQHPEAAAELERCARELDITMYLAEETGIMHGAARTPYPVAPQPAQLRGFFQQENARLAIATALALRERGITLSDQAIAQGLAQAWWHGRLEVVAQSPTVVVDGAHNGDSAQKLMLALRSEFSFERLILVLGTSHDKDVEAIVAALVPHADVLILTHSRHPRALANIAALAHVVQPYLRGTLIQSHTVPEALAQARAVATIGDLICVTGSLFVVGEAREACGLAEAE